ncbi:YugN family protein [Bacillus tianshenii]|nr:YugN family protein [Bacillus tianshenii]
MKLEIAALESKVVELKILNEVMKKNGLVLGDTWDYERVSYDRKFENLDTGEVFYLRVLGYAVEGNIDSGHGQVQLMTPLLGKHYYPHGVEYGEGEDFPKNIITKSEKILNTVASDIEALVK